ncbi:hypothetical protein FKM82_009274 [Ascaphus truei]
MMILSMDHKVSLVLVFNLWTFLAFSACQGKITSHQSLNSSRQQTPRRALLGRTPRDGGNALSLEDAKKEQGYYLQQLFHLYGENDTLTYQGFTQLLQNLGLGKVQVVTIQHTELGHDHVSHLDMLEVQENKHSHVHSSLDHTAPSSSIATPLTGAGPEQKNNTRESVSVPTTHPVRTQRPVMQVSEPRRVTEHAGNLGTIHPEGRRWPPRDILEHLLRLHNSHQHEDCLNVKQLLLNFGLGWVSEITPQQFTLLCPALLYQIDSRVCIQHSDQLDPAQPDSQQSLLQVLGWGTLAVTLVSAPSLLAVTLVTLLRRPLFRYLLRFLVALAVGTLCGDALLHLLPHAQEEHKESRQDEGPHSVKPVLKGLCVLGGLYLLFLIENLMGLLRHRKTKRRPQVEKRAQDEGCTTVLWELGHPADPEFCEVYGTAGDLHQRSSEIRVEETRRNIETHSPSHHDHSGHSHSTGVGGISEIVWMVVLGDGIHNFTDGLAIGAAFSSGLSGGLSTTVAVFCHELPHELGDFAVLMQNGVSVKRVLFFSLVSAFLSYLGMLVGTMVSQSSAHVTPWVFAVTAGIFLYVALVDMLPQMLLRGASDSCQVKDFILHSFGFLLGVGIMFCIALFQDQMVFVDL